MACWENVAYARNTKSGCKFRQLKVFAGAIFFPVTFFWGWWKKKNRRDRKERFATRYMQWAISELPRASVSKRVIRVWFAWKWTCRGHKFSHEWFCSRAKRQLGNSLLTSETYRDYFLSLCGWLQPQWVSNTTAIRPRYHLVHYPSSFILHTGILLRLHLQSNWLPAE